jgi:hypothetical protein
MYEGYDPQRIGLHAEFIMEFIRTHKKNHRDAKYKIGDEVMFSNNNIVHKPIVCKILAVNVQSGGLIIDDEIVEKPVVEYAISNVYGQLVWEKELEKI